MNTEHPVAINYRNDLFDTTWAHSQQNIGLKDQGSSPRPSPAGDRQCRQGRPRPGSGRSSSTWGGRWWTWWGRRPGCTCQYHWLASRRSWWEDWAGGPWGSWLGGAAAGPGSCHSPGGVAQSCPGAECRPRHWLCRSACSRCGTSRRPGGEENTEILVNNPALAPLPWSGSLGGNGLYLCFLKGRFTLENTLTRNPFNFLMQ